MEDNTDVIINKKSLEERAKKVISGDKADLIIDQILQVTDDESVQLYRREKIGKITTEIGTIEKEFVVRNLKMRKIEILFLGDSDFPDGLKKEGWKCCIFYATEITVA